MSREKRKATLKQTYYRSFLLLIVIPLILVFLGAELTIGYIIRSSAIGTINALQENISTDINSDIRINSLQLSHFIYTNNGEIFQTAAQVHQSKGTDWYQADQQLQQAFRTAVIPSQDILAGAFYMDGEGTVYMKDDVAIPEAEIRRSQWYRAALESPNAVMLGCYDTSRVRVIQSSQQNRRMILVTAMAVNASTDRSGQVEAVVFFTVSQVGDILAAQRRDSLGSRSVILDREGHVVFGDMGSDLIRNYFEERLGNFLPGQQTKRAMLTEAGERDYFFLSSQIPDTDWSVVTFVEESRLGSGFYRVGGIVALIVTLLLVLFYFYSRYFLSAIIKPVQTVCLGMERLDGSDLDIQIEPIGHKEIRDLMLSFNQMVLSIKGMFRLTEETMEKKHEAEIQALQSQINPHFIVNTLNSIRFMAQMAHFDSIRSMAEALGSIVSCSFRSNTSFYTVREELEMLKTYVYLMRIRYSNGFDVSYDVQPECESYLLPRLILQPVVENSITHGFDEMDEELGQIRISVYQVEGFLCLAVWDNGRGMSQERIDRLLSGPTRQQDDNTSIGLENVQARLRLNFGNLTRIRIKTEPGSFTEVTMEIPVKSLGRKEKEEESHDTDNDCR